MDFRGLKDNIYIDVFKYLLAINTAFTISSIMSALHRPVVIGHRVQIVRVIAGAVQRELPHIQVFQREVDVGLLLPVRVAHVLLGVHVEPLEMDDQDRWKAGYVELLDSIPLLFAVGAVPTGYCFAV